MSVKDMVLEGLERCRLHDGSVCKNCNYSHTECVEGLCADALKLIEQQQAEIDRLKAEKENAIKEIEERKAFNLKCDGQPEWLRKGIDVGLNTALDILKGKDGEQE